MSIYEDPSFDIIKRKGRLMLDARLIVNDKEMMIKDKRIPLNLNLF